MVLYGLASCILGWSGMSCAAGLSLKARGFEDHLDMLLRALIALVCVMGALASWLLVEDVIACLAFSFACACMGALLVCDLREHVLPTELVAALLVCAVIFRISLDGLLAAFVLGLPAGIVAGTLLAINRLRMRRGASELIGSGDLRMLVPLALFSGSGIMHGMFACAFVMGAIALIGIISKRVHRDAHIALAPGLAAWLFAGTLMPLLGG